MPRSPCTCWRKAITVRKIIRRLRNTSRPIIRPIRKGVYGIIRFYSGYGLYLDSPDPRLDQSQTYKAIEQLQLYLEYYPQSERAEKRRTSCSSFRRSWLTRN